MNEAPVMPFDDVVVIEVDNWLAAPSAGAMLADLGATVIKVEPIGGDPVRGIHRPAKVDSPVGGIDFWFDVDNRGKQSIAVDLAAPAGAQIVAELVETADIFLTNLLPRRQERFGLDPASLHPKNPRLVHATFTGYGTEGPEAWRPGFDVTAFFARAGIYDSMRIGPDGEVPQARPGQGDQTAGLAFFSAVTSALRLAERTGQGQVVETSLYETAVWTLAADLAVTAVDRAPVARRDRHHEIVATANRYPCGDGKWIVLQMHPSGFWDRFCAIVNRPDLATDERFTSPKARFDNMPALVAEIDAALAARSRDEWGAVFDEHGVIWGPVLSLDEVVADPQGEALALFPTLTHPEFGEYRTVRNPVRIQGVDSAPRHSAPGIGRQTRAVLAAAGYDPETLDRLVADKVILDTSE